MKRILSRFNIRYPRSLIYMLQASEYDIRDYLVWHHRVEDFTDVEKRKSFVRTAKSIILLGISWLIILCLLVISILLALSERYLHSIILFIAIPYLLAYGLIVPLLIIRIFIQYPIETFLTIGTRHRLKNHKGIKIAIAGSFGKTTMREILKTVLSEGKKVAAPPHSHNTLMGIDRFVDNLKGDEEILIFELGEYYPGDVKKLCKLVQPDIGIITGINAAHLKKFKTLDKTVKTIYELADYLKEKPVYINGESDLARNNANDHHIIYDREKIGEWTINNKLTDLSGTSFTVTHNNVKVELSSSLPGLHQIGPLAAAFKLSLDLGLSIEEIERGIKRTEPFDHRLKPKVGDDGVVIIDDSYNGNPDGVRAVIEFLSSLKGHRRFYVTPGLVEMGKMTEQIHREIGICLAKAKIEKIILINNSVTPYVKEGLKSESYDGEIIKFDEAEEAFAAIPQLTIKGDVVLLQNDWPDQYQ